jgi:hypothetical protein
VASCTEKVARPDFVKDEHLEYLDALRESGVTNMWGAGLYLEKAFKELRKDRKANKVLGYWMETFSERHPK